MKKFIGENMRYPAEALENKIEGTVFVKYTINYKGEVVDAKVVTGLGHGCDEEALRLVKLLIFKVEKPRGLRVLFHKHIQIHFRLPNVQTVQPTVQYNYTQTSKDQDKKAPKEGNGGYSYTISF